MGSNTELIRPIGKITSTVSVSRIYYSTATISPTTLPILPQHLVSNDDQLSIGLSCYPTTPGHALASLKHPGADTFFIPQLDFIESLVKVSTAASILRKYFDVQRCALVTEGSKDWAQVTDSSKDFHEVYPGYISSKDGPEMAESKLDEICSKIQEASGISKPFDYRFIGQADDENLFSRIVRGEIKHWRIWEDGHHVAFLTPFANTPDFTVLVPRNHLSSEIVSLDAESYSKLVGAAHTVAAILKTAFGTNQCGMIFEGFEIDYAHIKLIPIHNTTGEDNSVLLVTSFQERYQGYVRSLDGPVSKNLESLASDVLNMRKIFSAGPVKSPRS